MHGFACGSYNDIYRAVVFQTCIFLAAKSSEAWDVIPLGKQPEVI